MKAKNPAAVALGRLGGLKTTPAMTEARRKNAVKGGRPRGPNYKPRGKALQAAKEAALEAAKSAPRRDLASEFERALKRFTSEK